MVVSSNMDERYQAVILVVIRIEHFESFFGVLHLSSICTILHYE